MKFLEDFFSTDKMIYPFCTTVASGIIILILSMITNKPLTDEILIAFMAIGFLVGNYIKIIKIQESKEVHRNKELKGSQERKNIKK